MQSSCFSHHHNVENPVVSNVKLEFN